MNEANDQMIALNKAVLQAADRFAAIALEGAEHMLKVHMDAMKGVFTESVQKTKALAEAKDPQELAQLKNMLVPPDMEKVTGYLKNVYDVAATTQAEINQLLEEQFAEFNKRVAATVDQSTKAAPAGSEVAMAAFKSAMSAVNTVYDNMLKMNKQFTALARGNADAISSQVAQAGKKKQG